MATTNKSQTENTSPENTGLQKQEKPQLNHSERFTNKVLNEFGSKVAGEIKVTDYQRQLIQGYFIVIDRALKVAEENRVRKNKSNSDSKYDNNLPVTWENVNLNDLALDVVHYARMGLDMMQDNHLFPIPYKNNKTEKYDMTLMLGYNGIRYIAEKYAVEKPLAVNVELVFSTDTFKPIKKSAGNKIEAYEFVINTPFDRGKVVGGFGYIEYANPEKNKLIIMAMKDIMKRKPRYASAEFWGGKKKEWQKGEQVEVETDGWFEEMCLKTIMREVYSAKHIPRDPKKVDDAYQYMKMREARIAELEAQAEIDGNANVIPIDTTPLDPPDDAEDFEDADIPEDTDTPEGVDPDTGEVMEQGDEPAGKAAAAVQTTLGPSF